MQAVEAEGLVKRYRGIAALDGVRFAVARGSCTGLLGPNGAGKTTLLRILAAAAKPDAGAVRVQGVDAVTEPMRVRAMVGVVPQEAALYDELTPTEALRQMGRLHGLGNARATSKASELLGQVGLGDRAGSRIGALSGGMRHRLNLALGMVHDPEVLLLDEPTTGLDPGAKQAIWDLLRGIRAQGRTLVLSTHDMEEARTLCDRVALLSRGKVVGEGPPAQLGPAIDALFAREARA